MTTQQNWQWPKRQTPAAGSGGAAPQQPARFGGAGGNAPTPPARVSEIRPGVANDTASLVLSDVNDDIKFRVHRRLIQELETARLDRMPAAEAREAVDAAARQVLQQEAPGVFGLARDELIAAIVDEVLGLGPIEPLLRDPTITEVMVNGPDVVFYEREGKLHRAQVRFRDNQHVMRIIERIISPLGRRVDESSPMVDARLMDGSRVNIIIPPVSPKAPTITIRKFRVDKMKIQDLVNVGAMTGPAAQFLEACVKVRRNIIISGGTGSGKTTMLNALSGFIESDERIVTIEDPAELKLQQEHVITLEGRPPSLEGKNEVSQRDLVRNALRMRPDRIIIGEVRGGEAFDMLQAMNTGHEGSLGTVHANSPRDGLARIENMVLMAGMELPMRAIREQVASAVHMILQVSRFPDGSRKCTHISEVTGMEGQMITMQDLFKFEQQGIDQEGRVIGGMITTGIRPSFFEMFELAGIELPPEMFASQRWN
jgi:pilus assembly protein CpaF